jgi:hypothetical protein
VISGEPYSTLSSNGLEEESPALVTCTVKLLDPNTVGVPERTPPMERVSPSGPVPDKDHLYEPLPPVADNGWEYGSPIVAAGKLVVTIVGVVNDSTSVICLSHVPRPTHINTSRKILSLAEYVTSSLI